MRRAPVLAPSAWVLATAIAIGVSWLGVGAVTRAVTAAPEPTIPAARIAAQHPSLAPLPLPGGKLVVAAPAPRATSTPTTAPTTVAREPIPTIVQPATVTPATGSTTTTTTTTQPPSGSTGPGGGTPEGGNPPPPPSPVVVTFTAAGGQVSVTDICTGPKIVVDDVKVSNGFKETTEIPGPGPLAEVSFNKSKTTLVIEAQCSNGTPVKVPAVGWGVGPGSGSDPYPGQF
jgi:hypothetical protein